jgi:acyl-CoA thioesterase I
MTEVGVIFQKGDLVLFQGDSITDRGRDRANGEDMGCGYAMMAAAWFQAVHPELQVSFLNRGNSGNRAKDLAERWPEDCIDLRPDWVSIMIGINDTWRRFDKNDPTSTAAFEKSYRSILTGARRDIKAKFVLVEPFLLPYPEDRLAWREDLDPKIQVVRKLAREFQAVYVPLDGLFAQAATRRNPHFWAQDGVHPTNAGHALIARAWLQAVGALA